MRLVYFDEVKYQPPVQPYYWLGALSIPTETIEKVEAEVAVLAAEYFQSANLERETEFHAKDIFHRKSHFKDWKDTAARMECLERLIDVISMNEEIRKIYVRIDPSKMVRTHGWEKDAFMFLVERVQIDSVSQKCKCLLVGDLDGDFSDSSVSNLSRYREQGTDFTFGKEITNILDSVYFIPSHHSRLIQLADVYNFCLQLAQSPDDGDNYPRARLKSYIREKSTILSPQRYKEWPSSESWHAKRAA